MSSYPVEVVSLDAFTLDRENARTHSQRNLLLIRASLDEHGQDQALVVQRSTGRIIKGNGRFQAMLLEPAWIECEARFVDDDDAQAIRRSVADNRASDTAEWDSAQLHGLWDQYDLGDYWNAEELKAHGIAFEEAAERVEESMAEMVQAAADDPIGDVSQGSFSGSEMPADDGGYSAVRDTRLYKFAFEVPFDQSILVQQALRMAEQSEGHPPAEWLVYMAGIYLRGEDIEERHEVFDDVSASD